MPQGGQPTGSSGQTPSQRPVPAVDRVGEILRRRREERGDDIQFIADNLYIRRIYLESLEKSQYDALPADAYVIGFLRSYSTYLGLDSRDVINLYRAEMSGRRRKPSLTMPTPVAEGRTPSVIIMVAAAVVALLVYALWYGISGSDRASVSQPPALPSAASTETIIPVLPAPPTANETLAKTVSPALAPVTAAPTNANAAIEPEIPPVVPAPTSGRAAKTPPVAPAPAVADKAPTVIIPPTGLAIRAEQSSWVLVSDRDGTTVYDHIMKPGDVFSLPEGGNFLLTTGNAPGIILSEDGVDLPRFSSRTSTRVLRNVPMDSQHLRAKAQGSNNE